LTVQLPIPTVGPSGVALLLQPVVDDAVEQRHGMGSSLEGPAEQLGPGGG
jgi:hypothetical protein